MGGGARELAEIFSKTTSFLIIFFDFYKFMKKGLKYFLKNHCSELPSLFTGKSWSTGGRVGPIGIVRESGEYFV